MSIFRLTSESNMVQAFHFRSGLPNKNIPWTSWPRDESSSKELTHVLFSIFWLGDQIWLTFHGIFSNLNLPFYGKINRAPFSNPCVSLGLLSFPSLCRVVQPGALKNEWIGHRHIEQFIDLQCHGIIQGSRVGGEKSIKQAVMAWMTRDP